MEQTSTAGLTAALRWRRGLALRSQAARRDSAALADLYERHHQALYRYCRSILRDDEEARDALQSTMAKALAALRDEERDFEVRPWLFRIAHNEAISRVRQRREAVDLDAIGTLGSDSLAQAVEDRARLEQLRVDLRDLPERQRAALVLRELSGLSHEEIAVVLHSSARAVKQTIFEARSALHECAEGRAMLCADVQRALSDGDGRVLRGRRLRAHVRSCRMCREFKTALVQRPADLALLAPALPSAAGAALLAKLLPAAKAGVTSAAGTGAAGSGVTAGTAGGGVAAGAAGGGVTAGAATGGVVATVATKVAIVAVAAATLGGTGVVVRDAVTRDDPPRRPDVAAPATGAPRPVSTPASTRPPAFDAAAGSAGRGASATAGRSAAAHRHTTKAKGSRGKHAGQAAHAAQGPPATTGRALGQTKRQAAPAQGRRAGSKPAKSHPAHPAKGKGAAPATSAAKAHAAHPERPATATGPAAQSPGAQAPAAAPDAAPAGTAPSGNSDATHAAK
jgi:RNA polymerase sigma factor (sigma-70 family)